jgi:starvation-inducible DNA-binding protein
MPSGDAKALQTAPLATPTDLEPDAVLEVAGALNVLLANMIALYLKNRASLKDVWAPHRCKPSGSRIGSMTAPR